MAKNIGSVNPKIVIISGGEPLLDKDLPIFLREARKIASEELWLCTNGMLLSDEYIELLKKNKVNGVTLSLRHSKSKKEEKISQNKEVYKRVLSAAKRLRDAGIHVALEMTIMKLNYDSIDDFIKLGIDNKVDLIMFKRFRPIGRGEKNNLALSKTKNKQVLHHIFIKAQRNPKANIKVDDPLYSLEIYNYLENHKGKKINLPDYMKRFFSVRESIVPNFDYCSSVEVNENESQRYWGCKAGIEWVGIDPLGNVSPCPLLLYTGLVVGNVREKSLANIMETSSVIKTLKNGYANGKCSKCKVCGGCRSHAAMTGRGYLSKDPMCLEKSAECF
jgi:radical SAM protein with 4Fe4S-binding SPASM domain